MKRLLTVLSLLPLLSWGDAYILTSPNVVPDRRDAGDADWFRLRPVEVRGQPQVALGIIPNWVTGLGTVNATWHSWDQGKDKATQPVIASQPTLVTTNGVQCILFDGGDSLETTIPSNSLTDFTMMAWIRPSEIHVNDLGAYRVMTRFAGASQRGSLAVNNSQIILGLRADFISAGYAITSNTWYHAVGTFTESPREFRLIVDGVQRVTGDPGILTDADGAFIEIGKAGVGRFFKGCMGDITIWNRALTTNEVAEIYEHERRRYGK